MTNYLRYTDANLYYTMLAHGVGESIAYDAAEITIKTESDIDTAIACHHGVYHHLALVQVAKGTEPVWLTLPYHSRTQPRYPSCWVVLRWAEDPREMDDDIDYADFFDLTEDE